MANPLHLKVVLESLDKATGPINDIVRSSKGLQRAFVANAEAVKKLKIEREPLYVAEMENKYRDGSMSF